MPLARRRPRMMSASASLGTTATVAPLMGGSVVTNVSAAARRDVKSAHGYAKGGLPPNALGGAKARRRRTEAKESDAADVEVPARVRAREALSSRSPSS